MTTASPVRKRDADGLMLDQRKLLQALAAGTEPHQACEDEGITWGRFRSWIDKDKAFRKRYDTLFGGDVGTAKSMLEQMAVKAVNVVDDALNAEQHQAVEVTCEVDDGGCGRTHTVYVDVADMTHRKWASDKVFRTTEILKDVQKTDVTVTHKLDLESKIALQRARRGMSIPPHMRERFIEQGLLTEDNVVEGEFREVKEST